MVIAASRPIVMTVISSVGLMARALPLKRSVAIYFLTLVVPLLGSFITEPAAMTLAALMLRDSYYSRKHFQPPQIRDDWRPLRQYLHRRHADQFRTACADGGREMGVGSLYMLSHFGWKAAIAVFISATAVTALFYKELAALGTAKVDTGTLMPLPVAAIHIALSPRWCFSATMLRSSWAFPVLPWLPRPTNFIRIG